MTEQEILTTIRAEARAQGLGRTKISRLSKISASAIHTILYHNGGGSLYTITRIAAALGYDLTLVRNESATVPHVNGKQDRSYAPEAVRPENEYACLKCGLDAGIDEVSGHLQCHSCGHILSDCCGD